MPSRPTEVWVFRPRRWGCRGSREHCVGKGGALDELPHGAVLGDGPGL